MQLTQMWNNMSSVNGSGNESSTIRMNGSDFDGVWSLLIAFPTFIVNLFLLVQIIRTPQLHSFVHKLVCSMCVCSILSGLFGCSNSFQDILRYRPFWCLFFTCSVTVCYCCCLLHFVAISVERCFYIVFPFIHKRLTNRMFAQVGFIAIMWGVLLVLLYLPLFMELEDKWQENCFIWSAVAPAWLRALTSVGVFGTATVTTMVCYTVIFIVTRRHIRAIESGLYVPYRCQMCSNENSQNCRDNCLATSIRRAKRKAVSKLRSATPFLLLFSYFFASWVGNITEKLITLHIGRPFLPEPVRTALNVLTACSLMGNGILYMFIDKEVRMHTVCYIQRCASRNRVGNTEH